jgi:hypothetical protein
MPSVHFDEPQLVGTNVPTSDDFGLAVMATLTDPRFESLGIWNYYAPPSRSEKWSRPGGA